MKLQPKLKMKKPNIKVQISKALLTVKKANFHIREKPI